MQESYKMNYVLLPVPAEVLDELELDEFSTVQYSVSKGRLIIEPIDAEQDLVCIGKPGSILVCVGKHSSGARKGQGSRRAIVGPV